MKTLQHTDAPTATTNIWARFSTGPSRVCTPEQLTKRLETALAQSIFGEGLDSEAKMRCVSNKHATKDFSNELTVEPLKGSTKSSAFKPFQISGLDFTFDFKQTASRKNEAYLGIDQKVWDLQSTETSGGAVTAALDLLQKCAARANHDYFHHYTLVSNTLSDKLFPASDPLENLGYSGYEVFSIMTHQALMQKVDADSGHSISAVAHQEAKSFYETIALLSYTLDSATAATVIPYLSSIYTHFYQLSWGRINPSTENGKEIWHRLDMISSEPKYRWDTKETLADRSAFESLLILSTWGEQFNFHLREKLPAPTKFTSYQPTFTGALFGSVEAHFSGVEGAREDLTKRQGADAVHSVLREFYHQEYKKATDAISFSVLGIRSLINYLPQKIELNYSNSGVKLL